MTSSTFTIPSPLEPFQEPPPGGSQVVLPDVDSIMEQPRKRAAVTRKKRTGAPIARVGPLHGPPKPKAPRKRPAPRAGEEGFEERQAMHNRARAGITLCDACKKEYPTDDCWVLRAEFKKLSKPRTGKSRSRTLRKLCPNCLEKDPLWLLPTAYN